MWCGLPVCCGRRSDCGPTCSHAQSQRVFGHDPARKNAALFLAIALQFRRILEAFDGIDGLLSLLMTLRSLLQGHQMQTLARTER